VVHRSAGYRRYGDDLFENYSRKRQWTSKITCSFEGAGEKRNGSLGDFFLMAVAQSAVQHPGILTKYCPLFQILQLNVPIHTLCTSGGLKHKTYYEIGIVFLNRSVQNLNLAALKDRYNKRSTKAARLRF
jgi:hypothetical protein